MKLYTNIYDKNSLIAKTEPDRTIKNNNGGKFGKFDRFISIGGGEEIPVFTEDEVKRNQLCFLDGRELDSETIKTHVTKNGEHFVYINKVKTLVYTARQIENQRTSFATLMTSRTDNDVPTQSNPAKRHKADRSSSSSIPQSTEPTGYAPNLSFFHPRTAANVNMNSTHSQQRNNDINNNNNDAGINDSAGIADARDSLLTQLRAFMQPALLSPQEMTRSRVETTRPNVESTRSSVQMFINGLTDDIEDDNTFDESTQETDPFLQETDTFHRTI